MNDFIDDLVRIEQIKGGEEQVVTSSRKVAETFGKEHKNVLAKIDSLIGQLNFKSASLFFETSYRDERNKQNYREFLMNRDGFTLLVFGFTGKKAMEWKLKYIQAFNRMEAMLKNQVNHDILLLDKQNENLALQNENLRLRIELKKFDMPKPSEKDIQLQNIQPQKAQPQDNIIRQNSEPVSAAHSFSWDEPLKSEKVNSSDWKSLTEIVEKQLASYFPNTKESRKICAKNLNAFLAENGFAERIFFEPWSDGHYEIYDIKFQGKGQELINNGIVRYGRTSLQKDEKGMLYRNVFSRWHEAKAKVFFLEHQDEIKEFLAKPKKKSKK